MNVWDIVKTVGSGIISSAVPGGGMVLSVLNEFLDDDNKLPEGATGEDAMSAINSLPPEVKSQVMCKELDVKKEEIKQSHDSLQTMLKANATSTHTTRPKIAYQAFQVIGASTLTVVFAWAYAVVTHDAIMLDVIEGSWLLILTVIGPLVTVLHAYFGVLTEERKDSFNAAQGHKVNPVGGFISKILGK